ncbi:hypothetical protein ACLOJK_015672 [Asimina triloba]
MQYRSTIKFKEEITPEKMEEIIKPSLASRRHQTNQGFLLDACMHAGEKLLVESICSRVIPKGKDASREHLQQGYTHVIEILFKNEDDVADCIINPDHDYFDKHILRPSLVDYIVVEFYPIHMNKA